MPEVGRIFVAPATYTMSRSASVYCGNETKSVVTADTTRATTEAGFTAMTVPSASPRTTAKSAAVPASTSVLPNAFQTRGAAAICFEVLRPKSPTSTWVNQAKNCSWSGLSRPRLAITCAFTSGDAVGPARMLTGSPGTSLMVKKTSTATPIRIGRACSSRRPTKAIIVWHRARRGRSGRGAAPPRRGRRRGSRPGDLAGNARRQSRWSRRSRCG